MPKKLVFWFLIFLLCLNVYSQNPLPDSIPPRFDEQRFRLPEKTKVIKDIEYAMVEGTSLLLDIYIPEKEEGPLPLIVWIHGGGWTKGSKENCCPALLLLPYGYIIASINYRLSGIARFPAQLEDCKSAVRFLRANATKYNINPQRIGTWGSSAGGHLASMLGTTGEMKEFDKGAYLEFSSKVQAVCDYYGPSFLPDMPRRQPGITSTAESRLLGGLPADKIEKARKASPV
ncbi:MAG: alpha/beta hydrolase, partial [Candidatus Omnitrophica bacterium]|nr:alpha/beta hydrolase [Candidatus Omnitrophota bacterium]